MKKEILLPVLIVFLGALCACGTSDAERSETKVTLESNTNNAVAVIAEKKEPVVEEPAKEEISEAKAFSFDDLENVIFRFSSGVGAWSTVMTISEDGSFRGVFRDTNMGDIGEGYPGGSVLECSFSGVFQTPEKITDYSYSVMFESLTVEQEPGTEEIADGIRYQYTEAYGLNGTDQLIFYLPGTPLTELPEDYLVWVSADIPGDTKAVLPFYGIYNSKMNFGFSVDQVMEESFLVDQVLSEMEEEAGALERRLQEESLTQTDLNQLSGELYTIWDEGLNLIWNELKRNLDEEAMQELLIEQREWIASKEEAVKEAGADFEGGSIQALIINSKAAELTKERVYELAELLR